MSVIHVRSYVILSVHISSLKFNCCGASVASVAAVYNCCAASVARVAAVHNLNIKERYSSVVQPRFQRTIMLCAVKSLAFSGPECNAHCLSTKQLFSLLNTSELLHRSLLFEHLRSSTPHLASSFIASSGECQFMRMISLQC